MAMPAIGAGIELNNEKAFKDAVRSIGTELKALDAEMKLLQTTFEDNDDSVEALTATGKKLEEQIDAEKRKIDVLRAALEHATSAKNQDADSVNDWSAKLARAETDLIKLQRALDSNNAELQKQMEALEGAENSTEDYSEQLDESSDTTTEFGDAIDELAGKLGINLPDGISKSLNGLGGMDKAVLASIAGFAAMVAAIAEVEQKLISLTQEQAAAAGEIQDLSMQTSLSTETIQEYQYASELIGVSFDTLVGAHTRMIRSMSDAQSGTESAVETWRKLGVSIVDTNGNLRDSEAVFMEVMEALGNVENATERDAIAMEVFGRSAQDLNPLIIQGTDAFRDLCDEAHEVGRVLTDVELEALAQVDDALLRHNESIEAGKNAIALEFAPALQAFYESSGNGLRQLSEGFANSGLVSVFGSLLELVSALSPAFEILGDVLSACQPLFDGIAWVINVIADGLKVILLAAAALVNLLSGDWGGAAQNLGDIGGILFGGEGAEARGPQINLPWNAGGSVNWPGGLTWVGENGPEVVGLPSGSTIFNAQESRGLAGGDVYYITIDARSVQEFNDIVRIVQERRRMARMNPGKGRL